MTNRAGTFVSNLSGEMAYESFRPAPLPPNPPIEVSGELLTKLIDANKKIATLEGLSSRIPNMGLFVSMYVRKEALLSSQIEGTQCTLEDILNPLIEDNTNRDVSDVVNYIRANEFALERLKTLPLCNRLIKETSNQTFRRVYVDPYLFAVCFRDSVYHRGTKVFVILQTC